MSFEPTIGGSAIAYRSAGEHGPTLTLLHGGQVHSGTWEPHVPALAEWSHVVAPDLRGYGASPRVEQPWTIADLAHDVATLWSELGVERSYVVGFSQGGLVALDLALTHPDRVAGLVLLSTTSVFEAERRAMWRERASDFGPSELEVDCERHIAACFTQAFVRDNPDTIDWYRSMLADADVSTMRNTMLALAEADYSDRLGEISCPALVVYGTEDPSTGPTHGELLAVRLPDVREVVPLHAAPHNLHLEQPLLFVELVRDFVGLLESEALLASRTEVV